MFLRYVQVLRKLEAAHSHMVQPQKRKDLRRALECCMGRLLEIRNWMVHFFHQHSSFLFPKHGIPLNAPHWYSFSNVAI